MKYIYLIIFMSIFVGCSPLQKGDYVTYESSDFLFLNDHFVNRSIDCLELGEIRGGGLDVKYCIGQNYGGDLVQGFIFENHYSNVDERFIGATLNFKIEDVFSLQCNSETMDQAQSGREYINCMIPKRSIDLSALILNSKKDVHGIFKAAVGNEKVYNGVINKEGKKLLFQFYQDVQKKDKKEWKKRSL